MQMDHKMVLELINKRAGIVRNEAICAIVDGNEKHAQGTAEALYQLAVLKSEFVDYLLDGNGVCDESYHEMVKRRLEETEEYKEAERMAEKAREYANTIRENNLDAALKAEGMPLGGYSKMCHDCGCIYDSLEYYKCPKCNMFVGGVLK